MVVQGVESKIAKGVAAVYQQIDDACNACGRDPRSVALCFATKTRPFEDVVEAAKHCREPVCIVGENHVQTAMERVESGIHTHSFDKHFIGHLQSNKINHVLKYADCIQTVDTAELAGKIAKRVEAGRVLRIFLQVNTSDEEQKSGCRPSECVALAQAISAAHADTLTIGGLMTIGVNAPDEPEKVRACFRKLACLRDELNGLGLPGVEVKDLSMGMSGDLALAIEEGSTMVRVGTAIFGERHYPAQNA